MSGAEVSAQGKVVVGVDGSDSSTRAARYAAGVARRRGLGLLVVHVTPRTGPDEPIPMADQEVKERFDDSATRLVQAAAEQARQATDLSDVTAAVVDDYPVDGLLALSAEAALIVTGRRGTGGLPGLLLGSTAGALTQHAECPVIALPDEPDAGTGGPAPVVVGVQGRSGDDEVLAFAVAEAASRGSELTAVLAWRDRSAEAALGGFGPLIDWGAADEEKRRLLAETVARWRADAPDVPIHEMVVRDHAAGALLAASEGADLLVVGHRHRSRLARLGSTTNGVLHRAACPVAVVPIRERPSAP